MPLILKAIRPSVAKKVCTTTRLMWSIAAPISPLDRLAPAAGLETTPNSLMKSTIAIDLLRLIAALWPSCEAELARQKRGNIVMIAGSEATCTKPVRKPESRHERSSCAPQQFAIKPYGKAFTVRTCIARDRAIRYASGSVGILRKARPLVHNRTLAQRTRAAA